MLKQIVWGNLLHRKTRTVLTICAVAVEVMMILLIVGVADGLIERSSAVRRGIGADVLVRPKTSGSALSGGTAGLPEALVAELSAAPGVAVALPNVIKMQADLTTINGVDLERLEHMAGGLKYVDGGPPQGTHDIVVDTIYADQKDLDVGGTIRYLNQEFTVCGIVQPGIMARVFLPYETLQEAVSPGKASQVYLKFGEGMGVEEGIAALREQFPDLTIWSMEEFLTLFTAETRGRADEFLLVMTVVAVSVGLIVVLLSMYTAVLERTREVGILKSLGATHAFVVGLFVRETFLMTGVGVVLGVGISYVTKVLLEAQFPAISILISSQNLLYATLIAVAGSLAGVSYPAWRAARQDPVVALAYE